MAAPGHDGEGQNHDVYIELVGPSVADVHHNFVQRWNEASERHGNDGRWGAGSETALPFPQRVPAKCGTVTVQIQRTVHHSRYTNGHAPPEGHTFAIASGEQTNFDQYIAAIRAARRTIYLENQYVEVAEIVAALHDALRRVVEVVLLMPAAPDVSRAADATPERRAFLEARSALGTYDNFTLAGIAGLGADSRRKPVYVHAKLMQIDDAQDTSVLSDRAAFRLFHEIARASRQRHENGDSHWQGLAFSLDAATYGQSAQF
jgi:phosphatidylserine/phosphatidylglycerophosphate/cardiolipin synthase-like enzyme